MRSWWPLSPTILDDKRLLAEHNELLIIAKSSCGLTKGWRNHPEVKRWKGCSYGLFLRHEEIVAEMKWRGFNHKSLWPKSLIDFEEGKTWPDLWEPIDVMLDKLQRKQGS